MDVLDRIGLLDKRAENQRHTLVQECVGSIPGSEPIRRGCRRYRLGNRLR